MSNLPSQETSQVISQETRQDAASLRDLSPQQWKSGIAAWLGWLFDGLDMHLYVLVATPFVAELLGVSNPKDLSVGYHASWIQAAFLIGWALGGGFFGRIADRLGRSRALMLTIMTYATFTGLAFFAQTWWQLLITRFLAALGIGGEWAVGAAILSETWPRRWRPWMAAVLQSGVNLGIMLASLAYFLLADYPPRYVFLVGILPALLVLWIRRAVPEPEEWQGAKEQSGHADPGFLELFRGPVRRTTLLTLTACGLSLTAHWAFSFWNLQQLRNLPELTDWTDSDVNQLVSKAVWLVMLSSIAGNFLGAVARFVIDREQVVAILQDNGRGTNHRPFLEAEHVRVRPGFGAILRNLEFDPRIGPGLAVAREVEQPDQSIRGLPDDSVPIRLEGSIGDHDGARPCLLALGQSSAKNSRIGGVFS